ncbi:MAG TPA: acyl-CoA dehydrogenase [Candidatus Acidoferrum sp.]|nr:acyl-CoA dehydrogenase [Candidatus Acidoferrum sp.]
MDFALAPEQLLLRDSVARFAAEAARGDANGNAWKTFAELGWLAIGAPDDAGGFGGPVEVLLLMEQFGRGLVRSAYVSQAVLAGTILRAARSALLSDAIDGRRRFAVAYEEPHARYDPSQLQTWVNRDGDGWLLYGSKVRVLDPSTADAILVSARTERGIGLFVVPVTAPNVTRNAFPAEDRADVADVTFGGTRIERDALLADETEGFAILERGIDHATAALCAEALGLCEVMLETTVEYTKTRQQFGVALSSFQALQHRMAEMYIELELMRSMAYFAAGALDDPDPGARKRAISAAKAQVAKSGRFIGQQTIQLHGAIGMSEEYKIGHYFKRMTLVERLFGDRDYHLRRYVALTDTSARAEVGAVAW